MTGLRFIYISLAFNALKTNFENQPVMMFILKHVTLFLRIAIVLKKNKQ